MPKLKRNFQPDLILANAENIAHGRGITQKTLTEMHEAGIDFFTSGNHVWDKPTASDVLEDANNSIIRPANYIHKFSKEDKWFDSEKLINGCFRNALIRVRDHF